MPDLSDDQIADLRLLQQICEGFHADLAIIGAIAYQVHFPNEYAPFETTKASFNSSVRRLPCRPTSDFRA